MKEIRFEITTRDAGQPDSTNSERKPIMSTTRVIGNIHSENSVYCSNSSTLPNGISLYYRIDCGVLHMQFFGEPNLIEHWKRLCNFTNETQSFKEFKIEHDCVRVYREE